MAKSIENLIAILNRAMSMEYGALFLLPQHIARVQDEGIKRMLRRVEEMELNHAEKTAGLIYSLGGVPNADLPELQPRATLREILEVHIEGEKQAIEIYRRAAQEADNAAARDLLDDLRRDEEDHLRTFATALARVSESKA